MEGGRASDHPRFVMAETGPASLQGLGINQCARVCACVCIRVLCTPIRAHVCGGACAGAAGRRAPRGRSCSPTCQPPPSPPDRPLSLPSRSHPAAVSHQPPGLEDQAHRSGTFRCLLGDEQASGDSHMLCVPTGKPRAGSVARRARRPRVQGQPATRQRVPAAPCSPGSASAKRTWCGTTRDGVSQGSLRRQDLTALLESWQNLWI